ncbi:hypothetical protein B0H13DRAFT_825778 [Mycena leptocephala]|nr:hypothetical protein B0H13DRAFT_825778 [Mycena leptocephala]
MEGVSLAIDVLKKACSKSKDDAIVLAVKELNSILSALKSPSTKSPARLSKIFGNLTALYLAFPLPMCQLCANVLTAIYHEKVKPAYEAEDFKFQFSWEVAQKSVVSSVFDFIDQNPSKSNKTVAGNALYPTICAMFYPPVTVLKWTSTSLVFNVNLLLTESVTNHPDNQSRLRSEQLLGPTRMGCTLSQSKDFLVIDALLALIGVLLPPRQTARRSEFVDAVFTPELFPRSAQIKKLIAASSTDWDPVGTQIINECLAKSDLSFPQPFYTTGLRTSTPLPDIVDLFYIDSQGLSAKIEKNRYCHFPFITIERIKIGGPSGFSTPVAINLAAEPLVGPGSEADMPKKKCTMQFQLKTADAGRFLETLKARGLSKLISDTKVSKIAEGLDLEQLWQSNDTGRGEPTSPFVAVSSKEPGRKQSTSSAANSDSYDASSQHEVIFGDDLSDVSDGEEKEKDTTSKPPPPAPRAPAAASSSSRHRERTILHSCPDAAAEVDDIAAALRGLFGDREDEETDPHWDNNSLTTLLPMARRNIQHDTEAVQSTDTSRGRYVTATNPTIGLIASTFGIIYKNPTTKIPKAIYWVIFILQLALLLVPQIFPKIKIKIQLYTIINVICSAVVLAQIA